MHIAHAIMLFSSLEAVKAGKEKAIQIRGGEKGDFFSTASFLLWLPEKDILVDFLLAFSVLHSSGSFLFLRSSNIDNCYCAMSTTLLLEGRETYFTTAM